VLGEHPADHKSTVLLPQRYSPSLQTHVLQREPSSRLRVPDERLEVLDRAVDDGEDQDGHGGEDDVVGRGRDAVHQCLACKRGGSVQGRYYWLGLGYGSRVWRYGQERAGLHTHANDAREAQETVI